MQFRKYHYIILWLLFRLLTAGISPATASSGKEDSIRLLVSGQTPGTEGLKALNRLLSDPELSASKTTEKYLKKALEFALEMNNREQEAEAYLNYGWYYFRKGKFGPSLDYTLRSLRLFEELKVPFKIAYCNNQLARIYHSNGDLEKAIRYAIKCLNWCKASSSKVMLASCYNNLGNIAESSLKLDSASFYYKTALTLYDELHDVRGKAIMYNNLGNIFGLMGDFKQELNSYRNAMELFKSLKADEMVATCYNNIAQVQMSTGECALALENAQKGYTLMESRNNYPLLKELALTLSDVLNCLGNCQRSYEFFVHYSNLKDSVFNIESRRFQDELSTRFETEKKEQEIALLNKDKKFQKTVSTALILGLIFMLAFAGLILRNNRIRKLANHKLTVLNTAILQSKREVEKQKEIVENQKKEITDSIQYAKNIQRSLLPDPESLNNIVKESFIIFEPKDIVSGDFYFFRKTEKHRYIAALDCTGHGVPGGFMSMLGNEELEDVILQHSEPGAILEHLNRNIKTTLRQDKPDSTLRDGMDVALCRVDEESIVYSGANRPLWIIRKETGELEEYKPVKCSIGGFTDTNQVFEEHRIPFNTGDTAYIFTDGIADQFGGPKGKKLTSKHLRILLKSIQTSKLEEQKRLISDYLKAWQGNIAQVDDILMIGFRRS